MTRYLADLHGGRVDLRVIQPGQRFERDNGFAPVAAAGPAESGASERPAPVAGSAPFKARRIGTARAG